MLKNQSLKEAALEYAANGIPVYPLLPGSKIPTDWIRDGLDPTTNPEQIEAWWNENPCYNIGVELDIGFLAIELTADPLNERKDGNKALAEFEKKHGTLPPTLTITDDHGHRWLLYRGLEFWGPDFYPYPGVEILTSRCFVPLPPSVIGQYPLRLENQLSLENIAEVNDRVDEFLNPPFEKVSKTPIECFRHKVTTDPKSLPCDYVVPKEERLHFLYDNLKFMFDNDCSFADGVVNLYELNDLFCNPRLREDELPIRAIAATWTAFEHGRCEYYYV